MLVCWCTCFAVYVQVVYVCQYLSAWDQVHIAVTYFLSGPASLAKGKAMLDYVTPILRAYPSAGTLAYATASSSSIFLLF